MAKIGVVLSGCGVMDGAEIHEAVLTLYFLDRSGAEVLCMAPNAPQLHVVDHLTTKTVDHEKRNILVEAARIARGQIKDMAKVKPGDIDALIFPGGFGAAKNLCSFAVDGAKCAAHPEVARLVRDMHKAQKPLGFICIAPAVCAAIFKGTEVHPRLTIGQDAGTAKALSAMGAVHESCTVSEFAVDEKNKIVSTPAYMLGQSISNVAVGIEKLVTKILAMV